MFEEEQYLSVFSDQTKNKTFLYSIKDGVDMQKYQTAVDRIKNSLMFENAPSELSSSDEDTNHKKPVYLKKSNKNSAKSPTKKKADQEEHKEPSQLKKNESKDKSKNTKKSAEGKQTQSKHSKGKNRKPQKKASGSSSFSGSDD